MLQEHAESSKKKNTIFIGADLTLKEKPHSQGVILCVIAVFEASVKKTEVKQKEQSGCVEEPS